MSSQNTLFRVVTYHRIAPVQGSLVLDPAMISATPDGFARQMKYLAEHYNIISICDILDAITNGKSLPPRAVLISFDDGYYDLLKYAWPVLQKLKLPAVIFAATEYANNPEHSFWWDRIANAILNTERKTIDISPFDIHLADNRHDRYAVVKRVQACLKNLNNAESKDLVNEICQFLGEKKSPQQVSLDWEQLRQLNQGGIVIGAHSQTHPLLTRISLDDAKSEILGSQDTLKHEIGNTYPIFCYPNGSYSKAIITILKANGFTIAFTSQDGQNDLRTSNPYCLCRTNITQRTSLPIFKFRLTKLGAMVDNWRHR